MISPPPLQDVLAEVNGQRKLQATACEKKQIQRDESFEGDTRGLGRVYDSGGRVNSDRTLGEYISGKRANMYEYIRVP